MRRFLRWCLKWTWRFALLVLLLLVGLTLPLRWIDPSTSAYMTLDEWRTDRVVRQEWVPYDHISDTLKLAVIAAEDQKFPHHFGFDLEQIRQAIDTHLDGGRLRGASTITQQLARNLYLWPGQNWLRKGFEAALAVPLELFVPKHRLLEIYLNIAEFDDGIYGAEAAARHYFGKPASLITRDEAALLAAVLPAPGRLEADRPSEFLRDRQLWIIDQMENLGRAWVPQPQPKDSN
ncbi:monofunctional biosynthetic peptidoglycan transglycosylase [Wenzhouxiangella sp. XN201]|uniref:monofunctional biosynthetic peptidoglycan transglycosylase n=1 Tax=Wenzhouxiangella sp. XN201 TaxID=2710755 RepID=UPI0013CD88D6|nr:monofunctional biosynthetic peptidoglycan transglycosylase [Wenzhouxiangella sp. XN201]NEZ03913.1 monofunctional biosynthetic peptidoglycan transglycosylase [Wenzhouxiangella sp. XN201]